MNFKKVITFINNFNYIINSNTAYINKLINSNTF